MTQKRSVRRAQLIRHGIIGEFEADFLRTAMGRVSFLAALGQVAKSVQETVNQEGYRTLGAGHRYQQQFLRETGRPAEDLLKYYLEQDRLRFAMAQKTKNGLPKLDMLISSEMSAYGADEDAEYAWLIPEPLAIFAAIARDEVTDYRLAGQAGPDIVNNAPANKIMAKDGRMGGLDRLAPMHMVRNTPAFVINNKKVENVSMQDSQALRRVRQIGEYVTLLDETTDYSDYTTDQRSILMYNQEIDKMTRITIQDCIETCGLWDTAGQLKPLDYDASSGLSRRDLDDDFLTFLSPTEGGRTRSAPCEYLFDIAKEYLSIRKVIAGGETLQRAVASKYRNIYDRIATFLTNVANGVLEPFDVDLLVPFSTPFRNILGPDLFTAGGDNTIQILFGNDLAPVLNVADFDQNPGVSIGSKVDSGFVQLITHFVPATKKHEVQPIIEGPGSTLEKTNQIRDKILEYVSSKVPGLKHKDHDAVHDWYNRHTATYRQKKQEEVAAAGSRGGNASIAGYLPRGLNLEGTPYRYKYAESARAATDSIDAMLPVHVARCEAAAGSGAAASVQRSQLHPTGEGLGFAGIGQFAASSYQSRRDANAGFNENRLQTFIVHNEQLSRANVSDVTRFFARAFLMTRITKQNMMSLADHNVVVPMNFLLARPHMQYATRGIIKCAMNGKTGITPIGHSNFVIGHDVGVKLTKFHYTTHFRCVSNHFFILLC